MNNNVKIVKQPGSLRNEIFLLLQLSWPTILSLFLNVGSRTAVVIFSGHYLTTDDFDSVALGITVTNITGYSMMQGITAVMDSICPRAYGKQDWTLFSLTTTRTSIMCCLYGILAAILWLFIGKILLACGLNAIIAGKVHVFCKINIALLPAYAMTAVVRRFLVCQNITQPYLHISLISYLIIQPLILITVFVWLKIGTFVVVCWLIVFSYYIFTFLILLYIFILKPHHPQSIQRHSISDICKWLPSTLALANYSDINDVKDGLKEYFTLLIPTIISRCGEWWSYELISFLVGLLGPIQLAANVILGSIGSILFSVPRGLALASATRIGKLLAQKQNKLAKQLSQISLLMNMMSVSLMSIFTFIFRQQISLIFMTSSVEHAPIIEWVIDITPFFCAFIIFDHIQGVMQGILRALKLQKIGAIAILIGPWLITIPLACFLAFYEKYELYGFWMGRVAGYAALDIVLFTFYFSFDWHTTTGDLISMQEVIGGCNDMTMKNRMKEYSWKNRRISSFNISHFSAFVGILKRY